MRINHNISALNTHRQLSVNNAASSKSMEKLSSGLRINRAADDAAGLSISEKMRSQIRGLKQAERNAQDGISFIQTAEGALTEVSDMLARMKELLVEKANGTYSETDKTNIELEITQLTSEIGDIYSNTEFNGINVFSAVTIAANEDGSSKIAIAATTALSVGSDVSGIDANIDTVNSQRATFGAYQNRLEHTVNSLSTTSENLQAAESRIRDVDMASEMMEFTKNNILVQASQAMLAQANAQPQGVLQLLQ
jgi:flagellin